MVDSLSDLISRIPDVVKQPLLQKYPRLSFEPQAGYVQLTQLPAFMLVAFTGTGKTTTINAIVAQTPQRLIMDIPTRREIADAIIIPVAQLLQGKPIEYVQDRGERFNYTGYYGTQFLGGYVLAYEQLYYRWDGQGVILSDGVRGAKEIQYATEQLRNWHVIELWIDPLIRLQRLSNRREDFDHVVGDADLSFLPDELSRQVQPLLEDKTISPEAVAILRAESKNYGLDAYGAVHNPENPHYHFLPIEALSPEQVAKKIISIMQGA